MQKRKIDRGRKTDIETDTDRQLDKLRDDN